MNRTGYRGFLSLIWALFKANRMAKASDCKSKIEIIIPMRWFK